MQGGNDDLFRMDENGWLPNLGRYTIDGMDPNVNYFHLQLHMIFSMLAAYFLEEILNRYFNMESCIIDSHTVSRSDSHLLLRLTKQFDYKGKYRIKSRASIQFIKGLWKLCLFIYTIYSLCYAYPSFSYIYAISMDNSEHSVDILCRNEFLLHGVTSTVALYIWELMSDKYSRLNMSKIVHHVLTIIAALFMLNLDFNPFAAWFAFMDVFGYFVYNFVLSFRLLKSYKYPKLTKNLLLFSYYWTLFITLCNGIGQTVMFILCLCYKGEAKSYSFLAVIFVAMVFWFKEDLSILTTLKKYYELDYNDKNLLLIMNDDGARARDSDGNGKKLK